VEVLRLLPLQTATESYWTDNFTISEADLEFLYNIFLEEETPIRTPDLIQRLIASRIENEIRGLQKQISRGEIFQPSQHYKAGQSLVFPQFDFTTGKIVAVRPGKNPELGSFTVLQVEFDGGIKREIASSLSAPHALNELNFEASLEQQADPAQVYQQHKRSLTPKVVDRLRADNDTIFITGRWFLKSLLVDVTAGHLNLAEAVLDISDGGPLETQDIAAQIDFGQDANPILRGVSLDYALSKDDRFDEVGPAGKVWWFLKRMEPAEISQPPALLRYTEIPHNPDAISDDMFDISLEIDDELSGHEPDEDEELDDTATITLTYPHWRMGTLPLTQRVDHLFPMAYRAPRIKMTLVDAQSQQEMDGWVVRDFGYVYGLGDFYQRHNLPVGTYINIRADQASSKLIIDFKASRPRNQRIVIARVDKDHLDFREGHQSIGASFDDLMILGVEDQESIDALAEKHRQRNTALPALMAETMRGLAQFSPQGFVHAKTLYSALNVVRRCPPEPVFATLATHPDFIQAGGPYWRLA